ncbi:MAG: hypothetical protein H6923_03385 [Alphaproteobacteria bacterium]|nr:hypothetical protein [Alphaproteobacteria bacterium]
MDADLVRPLINAVLAAGLALLVFALAARGPAEEASPGVLRIAAGRLLRAVMAVGALFWSCAFVLVIALPEEAIGPAAKAGVGLLALASLALAYFTLAFSLLASQDALERRLPPFAPKRLERRMLVRCGYDAFVGYWVEDHGGARVAWPDYLKGAGDLMRALEREIAAGPTPSDRARPLDGDGL